MPIIDTTNVVQSSMLLKARTPKNMVMENEYIYDVQERRNEDWAYRSNVVDIEEELQKPLCYDPRYPDWSWTEVVIDPTYSETGVKLSNDWRILKFKDLKHCSGLGYRYRFCYDFYAYANASVEDREKMGSVWLGVNDSHTSTSSDVVVRRCQTNVAFGGVKSILVNSVDESSYSEILETHYEPVIIEDQMTADFKAINKYSNEVVSLPQAELYMILQANYYTRFLGVNDRFIIGSTYGVRSSETARNFTGVYEVKAVKYASASRTFAANAEMDVTYVPLIYVALDKALEAPGDNMYTRLAEHCPLYIVPSESIIPTDEFALAFSEYKKVLLLGTSETIICKMYNNGSEITDVDYSTVTFTVNGAAGSYSYEINENTVIISNLKKTSVPLTVSASFTYNGVVYTTEELASVTLGGFS